MPAEYRIANAGLIARSAVYRKTLNAGGVFSTVRNIEYSPFIGLDLSVRNVSGGAAIISLDGQEIDVPIAGVEITNTYYNEVKVRSAGDDGGLNFTFSGVHLSDILRARAAEAAA